MSLDPRKPSVMIEFKAAANKQPTLDDFCKTFNVSSYEVDEHFAIIPLPRDNDTNFLAVVSQEASERIEKDNHPDFIQNWSNPQMGSFGP